MIIHIIYIHTYIYFFLFGCGERALLSAWTIKTSSNWHALQKSLISSLLKWYHLPCICISWCHNVPAVINEFATLEGIYLLTYHPFLLLLFLLTVLRLSSFVVYWKFGEEWINVRPFDQIKPGANPFKSRASFAPCISRLERNMPRLHAADTFYRAETLSADDYRQRTADTFVLSTRRIRYDHSNWHKAMKETITVWHHCTKYLPQSLPCLMKKKEKVRSKRPLFIERNDKRVENERKRSKTKKKKKKAKESTEEVNE